MAVPSTRKILIENGNEKEIEQIPEVAHAFQCP